MSNTDLYPELIDYIYNYSGRFYTTAESLAAKTFRHYQPDMNEKTKRMYERVGWISTDPDVKKIIDNGFSEFRVQLAERIFGEHKDELNLNLCPQCNKIARTPMAKQCRFCQHDWH